MAKISVINFMANVGRDSWFHRLDPRTKFFIILFFSTLPLLFTDWRILLFFVLVSIPLWFTSNISFRPMIGPFTGVGMFLLIIFLLNALRSPSELVTAGTEIDPLSAYTWYIDLGITVITSHTFARGAFLAMRLVCAFTIGLLIISTTDPTYLAKGLRKLKMPIFVVFMVLAGLRFIPVVMEQLFNILDAMTIRGVSRSLVARTRLMLLPLLITSLRRTRTMGLAVEAKAFGARRWNNFYEPFEYSNVDKAVLITLGILTVAFLVTRFVLGVGFDPSSIGYIK
jgi:energy-coupling factor transport system permease protein